MIVGNIARFWCAIVSLLQLNGAEVASLSCEKFKFGALLPWLTPDGIGFGRFLAETGPFPTNPFLQALRLPDGIWFPLFRTKQVFVDFL